jgi:hypothetical protein
MAEHEICFIHRETWTIVAELCDDDGEPLDLSGAVVKWRIAPTRAIDQAKEFSSSSEISINAPASSGRVVIVIPPSAQEDLRPGRYRHELRVELPDGSVSTQIVGAMTLRSTLF